MAKLESCPNDLSITAFKRKIITPNNLQLTAFPNPFTNETNISYYLPEEEVLTIHVIDITGKLVSTVIEKVNQPKGHYKLNYRNSTMKSGTYFVVLRGNFHYEAIKLLHIR